MYCSWYALVFKVSNPFLILFLSFIIVLKVSYEESLFVCLIGLIVSKVLLTCLFGNKGIRNTI